MASILSPAEVTRYSYQIALHGWGRQAQERLKASRALVAGLDGLGTAVALHLLATGVGALRLVDDSRISLADLNTTILYRERDLGKAKAAAAERRLREINPFVQVEGQGKAITLNTINRLAAGCSLLIDTLKEPAANLVLNQAAIKHRLPLVHARVGEMDGLITTFWPGVGPCLACSLRRGPSFQEAALMGPLPSIMGALLAWEALRLLGGLGPALLGRVLVFKGRWFHFREESLKVNPSCPECQHLWS